jgi:hypothetical protein
MLGKPVGESCLEGGVNRRNLKFTNFKHTLWSGVSIRIKYKSEEREKQIKKNRGE